MSDGEYYIVTVHVFDRNYSSVNRSYRVHAEREDDARRAAENRARIDYRDVVFADAIEILEE